MHCEGLGIPRPGLHYYHHFLELKLLCVWGGGGGGCTFIRLLLGCALTWVCDTTCQIRLQTSDFIPIVVACTDVPHGHALPGTIPIAAR